MLWWIYNLACTYRLSIHCSLSECNFQTKWFRDKQLLCLEKISPSLYCKPVILSFHLHLTQQKQQYQIHSAYQSKWDSMVIVRRRVHFTLQPTKSNQETNVQIGNFFNILSIETEVQTELRTWDCNFSGSEVSCWSLNDYTNIMQCSYIQCTSIDGCA
jgi:hypothetical protein